MNDNLPHNMIRLTDCVRLVNGWSGPALTQYGQERVELGGPVVSRWLAKIANYLTNELATDLFDTGEAAPARLYTSLQPWQDVLWQVAARAMAWEILGTRRPLPGDLFVTNTIGPESFNALLAGAHVLAQPPAYLSFAWDGPLDGALDCLAEIAMQPDALIVGTPPVLAAARDEALAGSRPSAPIDGGRVALLWDAHTGAGQVLDQWMAGRSVVVIDPRHTPPDSLPQILATEDVDAGLVRYRR
ncbi:hypothetical protein SAMN04489715_0829 [Schaalia meyeri]|uniref:hypothetical protein n=1 Tax=Schaalia meyeri TaxID=52773 RepID=UPI0008941668|nr:hypothetical protein [Schaalia meyeri]SDR69987.1 hypothetical protein SAMN04489715_0829 [Schaalia meyeri]